MNKGIFRLIFLTMALILFSFVPVSSGAEKAAPGSIEISADGIAGSDASAEEAAAIIEAVRRSWKCFLTLDGEGFASTFTANAFRSSQRFMKIQHGRSEIAAGLKEEWQNYERPGGVIADSLKASDVSVKMSGSGATRVAAVIYRLDLEGGARWKYSDQGIVFSILVIEDGKWKIAYYADSWGLDIGSDKPCLEFDFVHPVRDIRRAVKMYDGLMGMPERLTKEEAVYSFPSGRFILEKITFDGFSTIRDGKPNGYAVVYVDDIEKTRARLIEEEAKFIAGTDKKFILRGGDRCLAVLDPAGNILVLRQREAISSGIPLRSRMVVYVSSLAAAAEPCGAAAVEMQQRWLSMDAKGLLASCAPNALWLDDTRRKDRGFEAAPALAENLASKYWSRYDRGREGILAEMKVSDMKAVPFGSLMLVTFVRSLNDIHCGGIHGECLRRFNEKALVTQLFESPQKCLLTMVTAAGDGHGRLVTDIDYTGYPATDIAGSQEFYQKTLGFGSPYKDTGWRGFWTSGAVFGIFAADPDKDGLPKKGACNGYISFWTPSAEGVLRYAKEHRLGLPVVPSINTSAGVTSEPGYSQAVVSDSEGNLTVFTQYSGRRKK